MQQRVMHKGKKAMLVPHPPISGEAIFERALSSSYTFVFMRLFNFFPRLKNECFLNILWICTYSIILRKWSCSLTLYFNPLSMQHTYMRGLGCYFWTKLAKDWIKNGVKSQMRFRLSMFCHFVGTFFDCVN